MTSEAEPAARASGTPEAEVRRLTAALEDIVALALSAGDARQRAILMHRRAVAALSGADRRPAGDPGAAGAP
ncbi:MAG: hypothetical protein AB1941_18880 [Gemmatimonadota bacterium]